MFKNNLLQKYKKWQRYIFKLFFLKNFNQKNTIQCITSIVYTILFFLISCVGFIPIIGSFISNIDFSINSKFIHTFLIIAFICSFFYLFDLIIRLLVILDFYNVNSLKQAFKKQLFSIYCYVELSTFLTTIIIIAIHGHFVNNGIMIDNQQNSSIFSTVISFVFLANLINCFHRLIIYSHNENEIKMFHHILKNKIKIWVIFIIIILVILFSFSYFIFVSDQVESTNNNPSDFKNMGDALYFCVVTITTVGFGDIVAKATVSKVYVVLLMIVGVFLYSFLSSQIISVFGEYFSGKKQISQEVANTKKKEEEMHNLINNIEDTLLKTLYEAKVITKQNYNKIINTKSKTIKQINNKYRNDDYTFDSNNKVIYYKFKPLGEMINDEEKIKEAQQNIWVVNWKNIKDKKAKPSTILFKLPMKQANEIADNNIHTQLIFSKQKIPYSVKKIIFYQKKPFLSTICEAEIKGILIDDKNKIWEKFGLYSNLNKKKFFNIFKEQDEISVILISDIIKYPSAKSIQEYGINDKTILNYNGYTPLS